MSTDQLISPPPRWETESIGEKNATFVNEDQGLEVNVRAVYTSSGDRRRRGQPTHYTVQLRQDWFAKGTLGERNMAAKVDTREEALATAREFMEEFTHERETVSIEEVEAIHRSVEGDHEMAERILTTEAAAEALADAAGYSDDLLLSVLSAETDDTYRFVAHRDGDAITTVAGDDPSPSEGISVRSIHAVFPVDPTGIKQVLTAETPITSVVHLGESTVYRFLFDDARETDIVLPRGTQVTSPAFETTVANVLEEKWLSEP